MKQFSTFFRGAAAAALILAITTASSSPRPVFASGADAITQALEGHDRSILAFTGTITEIRDYAGDSTKQFVMVEDDKEAQVNFVVTADSYLPNDTVLAEGMTVTGYYDAYRPMLMIYPPQPDAVALIPADTPDFVKIERFENGLVSYDGILSLNIGDDTRIITQNGDTVTLGSDDNWENVLEGKILAVYYTATTRSIPAQTTPSEIILLNSYADFITSVEPEEEPRLSSVLPEAGTPVELVVDGGLIGTVPFVLSGDDNVMVPLYLICPALELELEWVADSMTVIVGGTASFVIGEDDYAKMNGIRLSLGAAPVIIDDRTYVPLGFFTQVLGLNNAYYQEGQIVIDNLEKME